MEKIKQVKWRDIFDTLEELIKVKDRERAVQYMKDNDITPKKLDELKNVKYNLDPLYYAASFGDIEMVKILIDMGFSIEGVRYSTLMAACIHDKPEVVEFLVKEHHVGFEGFDSHGNGPPMKEAIECNSLQVVKCLLELGALPNQCYGVCYVPYDVEIPGSPLHHAIIVTNEDICQVLIDGGADVNITTEGYRSPPLFMAVCSVQYGISLILLEAGADVNLRNFESFTPFLGAVAYLSDTVLHTDNRVRNGCQVLDLLRSYGGDPEIPDEKGMRPLHHAVLHCSIVMVQYLVLQVCVSLKSTRLHDDTLFSLAIKKKRWMNYDIFDYGDKCCQVIEFLVAAGYDLREEPFIFNDDLPLMALPKGCILIGKLRDLASSPRSLKDMCIFKIRELLGCGAHDSASVLPLPKPVIKMIQLDHLCES